MKRSILAWAFVTVVAVAMPWDAADAQPGSPHGRWCVVQSDMAGALDCSYRSLEQCMARAAGVSNQCLINPWYEGRPQRRQRHQRDWR